MLILGRVYPRKSASIYKLIHSLSLLLHTCPILSLYIRRRIVAAGAEKRRGRSISSREHRVIGTMLGGLVAVNLVFGSRCAPVYVYACRRRRDVARRQRGE